jgi:hypothetical protein
MNKNKKDQDIIRDLINKSELIDNCRNTVSANDLFNMSKEDFFNKLEEQREEN